MRIYILHCEIVTASQCEWSILMGNGHITTTHSNTEHRSIKYCILLWYTKSDYKVIEVMSTISQYNTIHETGQQEVIVLILVANKSALM